MNIGDRVGDYEIVAVLGRGGMGQVYKIKNVLSERIEAMKVLLPTLDGDKDLADRFLREIKVHGALDHPNIAKLYNALSVSNQLLMVMEFIEGESLQDILNRGPLVVPEAIGYASQVLDALTYAHGLGVVHRDIKPANIMRTPAGVLKLLDFGLARMKTDSPLTQPGTTVGSLYYMSPEQIKGTQPDPRSDLYSFGVVLYEMVTGKRPFQGDSNYAVMAAHLKEIPPAPYKAAAWVPGPLSDIIMKAIAKDPADRFQSAQDFRAALRDLSTPASDQEVTKLLTAVPATPPAAVIATPLSAAAMASQATQQPASQATAPVQQTVQPVAAPPPPMVQAQPIVQAAPPPMMAANAVVASAPPPQKSGGLRWLYMSVGSLVTLGVLAFAAIEAPKYLKTHANETRKESSGQPAQGTAGTTPAQASSSASTSTVPLTTTSGVPQQSTASTPSTPANTEQTATSGTPAAIDQTATTGTLSTGPQTGKSGTSATGQQSQTSSATRPAHPVDITTVPAESPAHVAEIRRLREEHGSMVSRASAARAGLSSIKNQMASQGLGLRTDVIEAENRMNMHLSEAKQAIHDGDIEGAKRHLEMAQLALDSIERFLGH